MVAGAEGSANAGEGEFLEDEAEGKVHMGG